jgi:hypothetical protein
MTIAAEKVNISLPTRYLCVFTKKLIGVSYQSTNELLAQKMSFTTESSGFLLVRYKLDFKVHKAACIKLLTMETVNKIKWNIDNYQ